MLTYEQCLSPQLWKMLFSARWPEVGLVHERMHRLQDVMVPGGCAMHFGEGAVAAAGVEGGEGAGTGAGARAGAGAGAESGGWSAVDWIDLYRRHKTVDEYFQVLVYDFGAFSVKFGTSERVEDEDSGGCDSRRIPSDLLDPLPNYEELKKLATHPVQHPQEKEKKSQIGADGDVGATDSEDEVHTARESCSKQLALSASMYSTLPPGIDESLGSNSMRGHRAQPATSYSIVQVPSLVARGQGHYWGAGSGMRNHLVGYEVLKALGDTTVLPLSEGGGQNQFRHILGESVYAPKGVFVQRPEPTEEAAAEMEGKQEEEDGREEEQVQTEENQEGEVVERSSNEGRNHSNGQEGRGKGAANALDDDAMGTIIGWSVHHFCNLRSIRALHRPGSKHGAYSYRNYSQTVAEFPLLLAEPAGGWTQGQRDKIERQVVRLRAPKLCFKSSAVLALAASGRVTGLVLQAGVHSTWITPVWYGKALENLSRSFPAVALVASTNESLQQGLSAAIDYSGRYGGGRRRRYPNTGQQPIDSQHALKIWKPREQAAVKRMFFLRAPNAAEGAGGGECGDVRAAGSAVPATSPYSDEIAGLEVKKGERRAGGGGMEEPEVKKDVRRAGGGAKGEHIAAGGGTYGDGPFAAAGVGALGVRNLAVLLHEVLRSCPSFQQRELRQCVLLSGGGSYALDTLLLEELRWLTKYNADVSPSLTVVAPKDRLTDVVRGGILFSTMPAAQAEFFVPEKSPPEYDHY
jgi:hypothetical protein